MRKVLFGVAILIFLLSCANYMMAPAGGRYQNRVRLPRTENRPSNSYLRMSREEELCREMFFVVNDLRAHKYDPGLSFSTREAITRTIEQYDNKCTRPVEQNQE